MASTEASRYSLATYGAMLADRVRIGAFAEALRLAVTPESVVVDVGTGTGIFSLLACKYGARRVYAIDPSDAIDAAARVAAANGCADRIEFIKDYSTQVDLPERADVLVSDLRGVLPLYDNHLHTIVDARDRFLAAGGVQIPQRDTLWAGLIEHAELYESITPPPPESCHGLDMRAAYPPANGRWRRGDATPDQLLGDPASWTTLDYATVEDFNAGGETMLGVTRPGTAHGMLLWFTTVLFGEIGYSTGPGTRTLHRAGFFPLEKPVPVRPGDQCRVRFDAAHLTDDYLWRWRTRITDSGEVVKAEFDQSELFEAIGSIENLKRKREDRAVELTEDGLIAELVLASIARGRTTQGAVAQDVARRFPRRFPRWKDALSYVADLVDVYGRRVG